MSWNPFSLLRRSRKPIRRRPERRVQLGVELLETRLAPAATQPSIGANLGGINDWSRNDVFVDMMKQGRAFTSLATGNPATLGANGWPTQDFQVILQSGFVGAASLYDGVYSLSFNGQATVDTGFSPSGSAVANEVYNAATNTTTANVTFNANNSDGSWYFVLDFHNVNNVSNVKVIRPGYAANTTQIFTNEFLAQIQPFTTLRFMDWESTNGNPVVNWSDRSQVTDPEQTSDKGVAWEYAIDLANVTGKDIWVNIPEGATDAYVTQLATLLKNDLNPGIHVYVEYSNELWNFGFSQSTANLNAAVAEVQAGGSNLALPGETASADEYTWADRRVAQEIVAISNDFASVWGSSAINNQIRPVLASQMADSWIVMTELQYIQTNYGAPDQYIYAIAGAPYFNLNGQDTNSSLTTSQVLADFQSSIASVQTEYLEYAHWATYYGLHDLAYEGGPDTSISNNDIANKAAAEMDPAMENIVIQYLDNWFSQGGGLFMWYYAGASDYSSGNSMWGTTDSITDLNSPKLLGIEAVQNAAMPAQTLGTAIPGSVAAANYDGSGNTSQSYISQFGNGTTLDYLVQASQAGTYTLTLNYAANNAGGQIEVLVNDQVVKTLTLAVTGSDHDSNWAPTDFANASAVTLTLNQGLNVVRLQVISNGFSLKSLTFASAGTTTSNPPTVATPASASGVTSTTANLAVLGADSAGESTLTYTWSVSSAPSGAPAPKFSTNGTNAAKNTTVTFGAAGSYTLLVTIRDASGLTTSSTVSVTIQQLLSSLTVSPATASVSNGATLQLTATALDQFGKAMVTQPAFTWTASAGTVSSAGLFTAPATGSVTATVTAKSGSMSGSATLTIQQAVVSKWTDTDIGNPGLAGSAATSGSTITVTGGGYDIWGNFDQYNFAYQTLTGDGSIVAYVGSQKNTDPWAKAGVMIRGTTANNAAFVDVVVTPGNGVHLQYRSTTGGNAVDIAGPAMSAPAWVKLVRSGSSFTGYVSADGVNWTQIGTATITVAATVDVGLAVTAHNNSLASAAVFSSVSIAAAPASSSTPSYASGFTAAGLTLNGGAAVSGGQLQLTNGGYSQATSAYYSTPVNITRFTTSFDFQITSPSADGFTFVLQNNSPTAVGSLGGGLGYQGIAKSVAIKFDLYNNAGEGINSTGLYLNGAAPTSANSVNLAGTGIDLHSGDVFRVTMTYDGTTLSVTITDTKTGSSATQRYTVNIAQAVGGNTAYVGFTAGTGALTAVQNIRDWTFNPN